MMNDFLPISKVDIKNRGWNNIDIVIITGDAYVDHPSFGAAVIGRVLESNGFRVGIIAMPDVKNRESITVLGKPRLFFAITSGNVDSMIARYTAFKKIRNDDPYVPGGKAGHKPNRALIAYCNLVKQVYKKVPIVIGGLEASMRRIPHYDFWDDKVRRSILADTKANILVYGMGEKAVVSIAQNLSQNKELVDIPGTVIFDKEKPLDSIELPDEELVVDNKKQFSQSYKLFYRNQQKIIVQKSGGRYLVHYPVDPLTEPELDEIYDLPFLRQPHPIYKEKIPAFGMIQESINSHRGCVSGCSFCSLTLHQGKQIVSRSRSSILNEAKLISTQPGFKGHITDVGGPSANMYQFSCKKNWDCNRESCLFPKPCPNLNSDVLPWLNILSDVKKVNGIKHVTVGSGIRYDVLMNDKNGKQALGTLIKNHIGGQLKIAPEQTSPNVLRAMRKPTLFDLERFVEIFKNLNKKFGKKQHLIPYLMSNHPGETEQSAKAMKREISSTMNFLPDQVQSFIPLPMTLSSVIYYTGYDPLTGEKFNVTRNPHHRRKVHDAIFEKRSRQVKKR